MNSQSISMGDVSGIVPHLTQAVFFCMNGSLVLSKGGGDVCMCAIWGESSSRPRHIQKYKQVQN